jgi:hypothetical protein
LALVTKKDARLWTDGRYFLQATQQLSVEWTLMRMGEDPGFDAWVADVRLILYFFTLFVNTLLSSVLGFCYFLNGIYVKGMAVNCLT